MLQAEKHFTNRIGWLRAAVLGANDGILSTTSITIGVAAASLDRSNIVLASLAGMCAGAMAMAAGEYVSVSSQADTEKADLERERQELLVDPEGELNELALIYENRGLSPETAMLVAKEFTAHDALTAHAKDELGINEITKANPFLAAISSAISFISGAVLCLLVSFFASLQYLILIQYLTAIVGLIVLGIISAKIGGASIGKAVIRTVIGGTAAMIVSAVVGHFFGTSTM